MVRKNVVRSNRFLGYRPKRHQRIGGLLILLEFYSIQFNELSLSLSLSLRLTLKFAVFDWHKNWAKSFERGEFGTN